MSSISIGTLPGTTILPLDEHPFPMNWEQNDPDDCDHVWERALYATSSGVGNEVVIRCHVCFVPRCGHSDEKDPCMSRRHHGGEHVTFSVVGMGVPNLNNRDALSAWLES